MEFAIAKAETTTRIVLPHAHPHPHIKSLAHMKQVATCFICASDLMVGGSAVH